MNHPVAGIVRVEFDRSRLRNSNEHCVIRSPSCFGLTAAFRSGDYKLMAVQMNGVMIHSEVDEAKPYAISEADDERGCGRRRFAVEG